MTDQQAYRITKLEKIGPDAYVVELVAPAIAARAQPGHSLILQVDEAGARTPFSILAANPKEGTVSVPFRVKDRTTYKLARLAPGRSLVAVAGPVGSPSMVEDYGGALFVLAGLGAVTAFPLAQRLKETGNAISAILIAGAQGILWEQQWSRLSGFLRVEPPLSRGGQSLEDAVQTTLQSRSVGMVYARGPSSVLHRVAEVTRPLGLKTIAGIDRPMLDGVGLCDVCRVPVGGVPKLACLDGPDFDAHEVDWEVLLQREKGEGILEREEAIR